MLWSGRLQCNALAVHVINNFQISLVQEDYTEQIWCGRLQLSWTGNAVACHRDGFKIVKLFEKHRNAAIRWFQNDTYEIMDYRERGWILGMNEKAAEKFSKEWYNIKRREAAELRKQRKEIHNGGIISMGSCGRRLLKW